MSIIQRIADLFSGVRVPRFQDSYGVPNTPMSPSQPDMTPYEEYEGDAIEYVLPEDPQDEEPNS